MTRKDYIATARIIRALRLSNYIDDRAQDAMAKAFSDMFTVDNARFDRGRFYYACGLDSPRPINYLGVDSFLD